VSSAPDLSSASPANVEEELAELRQWLDDFARWQEWSAQWRSRRQPGWFTASRTRMQKPAPPEWLPGRCLMLIDEGDPLANACGALKAWREDDTTYDIRQAQAAVVTRSEESGKTKWWQHIHMDLMWPAMQWQSSVYGVAGMHVATKVAGRFQIFTAPGAMLLNVPTRSGGRVWKIAANYGIGYKVMDFTFPGNRPAELHLNLAKLWMLSDPTDAVTGRTLDVVGFSVSFKPSR
jgi:hypothetical protein